MKHFRISILLFLASLLASYSANNLSHFFNNISLAYGALTALCILIALLSLTTALIASSSNGGIFKLPKSLGVLSCWMLAIPQVGIAIGLVLNYNSYIDIMTAFRSYSGEEIQNVDRGIAILDGDIGYASFLSLMELHQKEEITVLQLRSHGGVLSPAISIGEFLKENRIATQVDGYCESACVLVALYGSPLYVAPEAQFGFHSGRSVASHESKLGQDIAKLGTGTLLEKLGELGTPDHILEMAENTPPQEMHYVSGSELKQAGLAQLIVRQPGSTTH